MAMAYFVTGQCFEYEIIVAMMVAYHGDCDLLVQEKNVMENT